MLAGCRQARRFGGTLTAEGLDPGVRVALRDAEALEAVSAGRSYSVAPCCGIISDLVRHPGCPMKVCIISQLL